MSLQEFNSLGNTVMQTDATMESKSEIKSESKTVARERDTLSLDDGSCEGTIKIVSKDGGVFTVEKKYAFVSNLVKTSMDTDASAKEIPMPGVMKDVLALIVDYMVHHLGTEPPIIEKPLRSKIMKDVCKDPW